MSDDYDGTLDYEEYVSQHVARYLVVRVRSPYLPQYAEQVPATGRWMWVGHAHATPMQFDAACAAAWFLRARETSSDAQIALEQYVADGER